MHATNRILLVNPPGDERSFRDRVLNYGMEKMPLGLLSLASYVRMHGREDTRIVDLYASPLSRSRFEALLRDFKPDVVGITVYTLSVPEVREIARAAKCVLGHSILVFGGPHASFRAREMLTEAFADFVVRREGESTFIELLSSLETGFPPLEAIAGLSYFSGGRLIENPDRPPIGDVEALPYADVLHVDPDHYGHAYSVSTSRGCLGNCIFCAGIAMAGAGVRGISAEAIFDRFRFLHSLHDDRSAGTDTPEAIRIYVEDPCFTADPNTVAAFCDLKIRNGLDTEWECLTRFDCLSPELLRTMAEARCRAVLIGVESMAADVQRSVHKVVPPAALEEILACASGIGIEIGVSFILGLPGETRASIERTWEYVKYLWRRYELTRVDLNANAIYPGTYQELHFDELGLRLESGNPHRCSRMRPSVFTDDFGTADVHRIMVEYFRLKKTMDRAHRPRLRGRLSPAAGLRRLEFERTMEENA